MRNGLDVPVYLGSRSTFVLGQFGGHAGRPLRAGDMVRISNPRLDSGRTLAPMDDPRAVPAELFPAIPATGEIGVLNGPHGAPDYFTLESMDAVFCHRLGGTLQLEPAGRAADRPQSRYGHAHSGGEAGLHPSNVHDCEYALGSINFTGDQSRHPHPRRPQSGRFRLPRHYRQSGTLEDWPG